MTHIRLALDVQAQLGEGLHWDAVRGTLWMVDIRGRRVIQWVLDAPSWREWQMPERVGWVIPHFGTDDVLLGLQQGIAAASTSDLPTVRWIARPFAGRPDLRLNDAKADPSGAIWAGSMNGDDESRIDGCLYRLSTSLLLEQADSGYCIPNGPAIHPDGTLLLHTDSARRDVYAFDLDHSRGRISNKRLWRRFAEGDGNPDGMCFDADGCVWVAQWGAGRVSRLAPDGKLIQLVDLPTPLVTNVCFAGPRLDRLFVTTARGTSRDADAGLAAGALFEIVDHCTLGSRAYSFGERAG